ncbi:hypothetical protein TGARI_318760A, partial [Toxoplasma gondii ARI]
MKNGMEGGRFTALGHSRGLSSAASGHGSASSTAASVHGDHPSHFSSLASVQTSGPLSSLPSRSEGARALPTRTTSLSGKSDRLHRLEQRLSGLHAGLEKQRQQRYQHLIEKLQHVEEDVADVSAAGNEAQSVFREELRKIEADLRERQSELETDLARREQQTQEMERRLTRMLQTEQEALREVETSLMNAFTEKTKALREEILQSGQLREEQEASLRHYCEVEIPRLRDGLQQEVRERENMER